MIISAILKINPNAVVSVANDDIDQITWLEGTPVISKSDIQAQIIEVKKDLLREARNKKLAETDYLALSDQTLSTEMTTYRQALRDLPSNYTTSDGSELAEDLSNLVWPTKP